MLHLPRGKKPPKQIACHWCGLPALYRGGPPATGFTGDVLLAIPAHFNRSLNRMVYGRGHLEHLQKKLGVCDVSSAGLGEPSTGWR